MNIVIEPFGIPDDEQTTKYLEEVLLFKRLHTYPGWVEYQRNVVNTKEDKLEGLYELLLFFKKIQRTRAIIDASWIENEEGKLDPVLVVRFMGEVKK